MHKLRSTAVELVRFSVVHIRKYDFQSLYSRLMYLLDRYKGGKTELSRKQLQLKKIELPTSNLVLFACAWWRAKYEAREAFASDAQVLGDTKNASFLEFFFKIKIFNGTIRILCFQKFFIIVK